MYSFVFYFIYRAQLSKDGELLSRYSAHLIITVAWAIFLGMLYGIARFLMCYFYNISIARKSVHQTANEKGIVIAISIALFLVSCLIFNKKKVENIVERYKDNRKFYSLFNIIKFILIFLIPLLIGIFFENKSLLYCF